MGFAFIACLTAVGGGTIRDLLLDRNPIFWIETPSMLGGAIAAAGVAGGSEDGAPADAVIIESATA